MKRIIFTIVAGLIWWPFLLSGQENTGTLWKAGIARVVITPQKPMWMAGYAARVKPSEGMLQDLWAKALYLEDNEGKKALLVTTDLIGFPKEMSDQIRDSLQNRLGLSRAQIILNSSHTHSGPVLSGSLNNIYPMDDAQKALVQEYSNWLVNRVINVGVDAMKSAEPAKIFSNNGVVRFQVNRRNNKEASLTGQSELKGPSDYAVPVLKIAATSGEIRAIVFGYACHATVLSGYLWSGDYPGFAQDELEKKFPGTCALFFQGAGSDQNPMPRRSVALAIQYGTELAAAVERVLNEEMKELLPRLNVAYHEIDLPLNPPPGKKKLEKIVKTTKGYEQVWATNMLEQAKNKKPFMRSYPYPLLSWKLGDLLIFSLGGELSSEYAIKLKQMFGDQIFVMGYSNDVMAYIPSETILKEGGYEGLTSLRAYGFPSTWKKGIEQTILNEMLRLTGNLQ